MACQDLSYPPGHDFHAGVTHEGPEDENNDGQAMEHIKFSNMEEEDQNVESGQLVMYVTERDEPRVADSEEFEESTSMEEVASEGRHDVDESHVETGNKC